MKVLTIANEKGGVGKSLVAGHAAWFLSEKGRTLVIDLDQQEAALSVPMMAFASNVEAINLFAEPCAIPAKGPLTLAARTRELEAIERQEVTEMVETFRKSLALCAEHYDFVVLDTPPAFGIRTSAALLVADMIVAPIELNEASIEAVQSVVNTISAVCGHFGKPMPDITRQKLLLVSRYSTHSPRQRALFEDLSHSVGRIVIDGAVIARDAYARSRSEQKPVWEMRDAAGRMSSSIKQASDEIRKVLGEIDRMMALGAAA